MITPQLVAIDSVRPDVSNPRAVDQARLAEIVVSLRKLGFLIPIYADQHGLILSGHQRHTAAVSLGYKRVPVIRVEVGNDADRRAINLLFNRGTNDFRGDSKSGSSGVDGRDLDDVTPDSPESFRCMDAVDEVIKDSRFISRIKLNHYARMVNGSLRVYGIKQPIIVSQSNEIVNGNGRAQVACERGPTGRWPVVYIADAEVEFADAALNRLSMDYSLDGAYSDVLRFNSFRAFYGVHKSLPRTFMFMIAPSGTNKFTLANPANAKRWVRCYGRSVVDFGAGLGCATKMMRSAGVDVAEFEPYRATPGESGMGRGGRGIATRETSVPIVRRFLDDIASGRAYTSIFLSAVLNSVPHLADLRAAKRQGGAIVVVDRVAADGYHALICERMRMRLKGAGGESAAAILEKEFSLAGIQRPVDEALLAGGVRWFQMGVFVGWIIE